MADTPKIGGWNYRVMRRAYEAVLGGETRKWVMYGIYEVYYDDSGKPNGWSTDPQTVDSEQPDGVGWIVARHVEAMQKPLLDYDNHGAELSPLPAADYLATLVEVEE